jgi:hypothetical protein
LTLAFVQKVFGLGNSTHLFHPLYFIKPFLLSVENEFYAFRVRNDRGSILGLHTKPVTFFSNIRSYSLRSKSYNSALFLEGFYKVWRKLCSTEYIQNVYLGDIYVVKDKLWIWRVATRRADNWISPLWPNAVL